MPIDHTVPTSTTSHTQGPSTEQIEALIQFLEWATPIQRAFPGLIRAQRIAPVSNGGNHSGDPAPDSGGNHPDPETKEEEKKMAPRFRF